MRITKQRLGWRRQYLTLVLGVAGVIALSLMLVQVRGGFAYPPLFSLFAKLFQIQFGLLGGAVLAALLYLLPHSRLPWLGRSLVFGKQRPYGRSGVGLVISSGDALDRDRR